MTDPDGLTPEERADADARSTAPAGRVLSDARDARGVLRHDSAWPFFAMVVIALGVFSLIVQREPAVRWIAGGLAAYLLWQGYAPVRRISHDADGPLLHPGLGRRSRCGTTAPPAAGPPDRCGTRYCRAW